MNYQQFDQALNGKVSTAVFNPPILNSRDFMVEGKVLVAGIAFFLAQFCQLLANMFLKITTVSLISADPLLIHGAFGIGIIEKLKGQSV